MRGSVSVNEITCVLLVLYQEAEAEADADADNIYSEERCHHLGLSHLYIGRTYVHGRAGSSAVSGRHSMHVRRAQPTISRTVALDPARCVRLASASRDKDCSDPHLEEEEMRLSAFWKRLS
jgi:hypothetical protein